MRNQRAQSAMEYLMTYGWAILIIAVVLGALFALGVFNSSSFLGSACVAQPGYLCQQATLNDSGVLTMTLGQSNGYNEYNIKLACTATQASNGGPNNASAYNNDNFNRALPAISWGIISTNSTFPAGVSTQVSGIQCYTDTGVPASGLAIGQSYTGTLWIEYATTAGTGPSIVAPVATIALKVS